MDKTHVWLPIVAVAIIVAVVVAVFSWNPTSEADKAWWAEREAKAKESAEAHKAFMEDIERYKSRFGYKTPVVWVEDGNRFYHRLMCPSLGDGRRPVHRDAAADDLGPCRLCEPGPGGVR